MQKRINISLSDETLRLIERASGTQKRSRFIDVAVRYYIKEGGRAHFRKQLEEEAIKTAERDLEIAAEWFPLDQEAWDKIPG